MTDAGGSLLRPELVRSELRDRPADDPGPHRLAFLRPGDLDARALREPAVLARRRAMLAARPPHVAPLLDLHAHLRRLRPEWEVPDPDPAGGGAEARALFLLEKPSAGTALARSGLVSIQNDTQTGEAIHAFLRRRDVPAHWCLLANAVPWWDGSIRVSPEQRRLSGTALAELLGLLPFLRAVVLVGATAARAWDRSGLAPPPGARVWRSAHPSPQVRAAMRARWEAIPEQWPDRAALEAPLPGR